MASSSLASFKAQAEELGRTGFAERYPLGLLVRFPTHGVASVEGSAEDETAVFSRATLEAQGAQADWILAPLVKRPGNPFPTQLFVGRARQSDICLEDASVTRVHAYFKLGDGVVAGLRDCGSGNGTFVNGVRLGPDELRPVRPGDSITFGVVQLQLVTALVAHGFLSWA
ncbi:MAG: FHA domain-containing protein [Polyangiaceae bacterium]|nr:FHA domain-containing protein [Polyangiaceae bacterium]